MPTAMEAVFRVAEHMLPAAVQPDQTSTMKPFDGAAVRVTGLTAKSASQTQVIPDGQVPKQLMPAGLEVTAPCAFAASMVTLRCAVPLAVIVVDRSPASVLVIFSVPVRISGTVGA